MSAIAAKVFSGLMKVITPATSNNRPKRNMTNRSHPPTSAPYASCWKPDSTNMIPISTPTVVTEA